MRLLEILDDRERLRERRVAVLEHRHQARGLRCANWSRELLAAAAQQVHGYRGVVEPLEIERDAHAIGRGAAEIGVQTHAMKILRQMMCRQHAAPRFAEADARGAARLQAMAAQNDLIAVFQKAALLATRQAHGLLAAVRKLQQRAGLRGSGSRLRAGAQQIAAAQVAAVDGVVRQHLRDASSRHGGNCYCDRRVGAFPAARIAAVSISTSSWMSMAPRSPHRSTVQIGQAAGHRPLRAATGPKRLQRLECDDPGRNRGGEVLAQKGTQRLVFPGLQIARRPVVEQAQAEDMRTPPRRCRCASPSVIAARR